MWTQTGFKYSQSSGWFAQLMQRSDGGVVTWSPAGNKFEYEGLAGTNQSYDGSSHPWEFKWVSQAGDAFLATGDAVYAEAKRTFDATYDEEMISLSSAEARARKIRVLLFDVDGVLTDGQLTFIPKLDGTAIETKGFHAHDGLGISLARLGGLRVGIITKRQSATVAIRARDLKLEFVYQGQAHKLSAAEEIAAKAGITLDEVCYVGDDIVDLPVMRKCGLAIATANARQHVKEEAHWVTPLAGGQGAGRDAIEFILNAQGSLKRVVEQYLDADDPTARSSDIGTGNM